MIEIRNEYSRYVIVLDKISAIKYVNEETKKGCIYLDSKESICDVDFSYLDKIVDLLSMRK